MIPDLEKDLGFCFHWIKKEDWENSFNVATLYIGKEYFNDLFTLFSNYMQENDLVTACSFRRIHCFIGISDQIGALVGILRGNG